MRRMIEKYQFRLICDKVISVIVTEYGGNHIALLLYCVKFAVILFTAVNRLAEKAVRLFGVESYVFFRFSINYAVILRESRKC